MDMSAIQKRIELIEKHEQEIRNAREMLKGELENTPEFLEAQEEYKQISQKRKRLRDEIMNQGPNQKLLLNIKESQEEISTLKEILSAELVQVFKEQDVEEITDSSGETRKFKLSVKLLPKRSSYQNRDRIGQYLPEQKTAQA